MSQTTWLQYKMLCLPNTIIQDQKCARKYTQRLPTQQSMKHFLTRMSPTMIKKTTKSKPLKFHWRHLMPWHHPQEPTSLTHQLKILQECSSCMPKLQTFESLAIQLTFFSDNNNSIPSWTISALSATYHHGHAMSLTLVQNKSAFLIHALVQPSTTWSSQTSVIPASNTLLIVHQMPELQSWLWDVTVHRSLKIMLNARATPSAPLNKDTKKPLHHTWIAFEL